MAHIMEPTIAGACDNIINLGSCWDNAVLFEKREQIADIMQKYSAMQKQAGRCINAASVFLSDIYSTAAACTNTQKINNFCSRLLKRELSAKHGINGECKTLLFSAFTKEGVIYHEQSIALLAEKIYVLNDEWGAASSIFLSCAEHRLKTEGREYIKGVHPLFPHTAQQIIIPDCRVAFIVKNRFLPLNKITPHRVFHAGRFTNTEQLSAHKNRIVFNKKAANHFFNSASENMALAKEQHDLLEQCYIPAMDFEKLNELYERLNYEIFIKNA